MEDFSGDGDQRLHLGFVSLPQLEVKRLHGWVHADPDQGRHEQRASEMGVALTADSARLAHRAAGAVMHRIKTAEGDPLAHRLTRVQSYQFAHRLQRTDRTHAGEFERLLSILKRALAAIEKRRLKLRRLAETMIAQDPMPHTSPYRSYLSPSARATPQL